MSTSFAIVLLLAPGLPIPAVHPAPGLPLEGDAAERFLRTADVVGIDQVGSGTTKPLKATLTDGSRTLRAIFKTVDEIHMEAKDAGGRRLFGLRDSYKHEIAAYQLDKALGLGIVPPCVERSINGSTGSLCMWVEEAITETQRRRDLHASPPDELEFANQMTTVRIFHQLIWDADSENISNILIDASWRVYKVDSSRAFRRERHLEREKMMFRFPRRMLASLEALTVQRLDQTVGPWLDAKQKRALWERRNEILDLAERRINERGPAVVF